MSTTNSNGQSVIERAKTLPATVSVVLNGETITATGVPAASGNIWYEAVLEGEIGEGKTIEQALLGAVCSFEGEELPLAKKYIENGARRVQVSLPRKFEKGHAKEGQAIPNTGGNQTLSFFKLLPDMGERGYQLRVTLTGIEDGGVRKVRVGMACQTTLPRKQRRTIGHVSAPLTF